ncbi:O-antigen ligase family protein [Cobetia marina]|uniref:O-antigen ligase family protein n=1 Tax=Cobetia marina TaxID=28258 RepID=UPI00174C2A45
MLLIFYVFLSTRMLGFFDIEALLISGTSYGFFIINLIVITTALLSKGKLRIPRIAAPYIFTIVLFIFLGTLYPVILGYQNLIKSIIASKDMFYYSILVYIILKKNHIDYNRVCDFLHALGLYLSVTFLVTLLLKVTPPFYITDHVIGMTTSRVFFPTYISLALFIVYDKFVHNKLSSTLFYLNSATLTFGIYASGHLSIFLTSILSLLFLSLALRRNNNKIYTMFKLIKAIIIGILISLLLLSSDRLRTTLSYFITSIVVGDNEALSSRDKYNLFRWNAIEDSPLFGYGFVHKSSDLMQIYASEYNTRFTETLSVIDSGYVDLLVKFGYVGMFSFLLMYFIVLISILYKVSHHKNRAIVYTLFLFQFYLINYTWSVFTFSHGIIPISIALGLLISISSYRKGIS